MAQTPVECCGGEKVPGPDGLTFKLIKANWDLMSGDIFNFVKYFEQHASMTKGCNSSFITLIPKVADPLFLTDYRSINHIGCMYKIVANVLALRLKSMIGSIVSEVRSAFIPGRNILDGPLVINEIFSWAKQLKKRIFLLNWNYLDSVMEQMNFGAMWQKWIHGCLASSMTSVLVNGSPTDEFPTSRGVRQGDPLSPFLFIMAMKGLNV